MIYELVFTRPSQAQWGTWAQITNARIIRIKWISEEEKDTRISWTASADLGNGKDMPFTRVNVLLVCKQFSLHIQEYLDRRTWPVGVSACSIWRLFQSHIHNQTYLNIRQTVRVLDLRYDPEAFWEDPAPEVPSGPFLTQDERLAAVANYTPGDAHLDVRFQVQYGSRSNWIFGPRMLKVLCQFQFLSIVTLDFRIPVYVEGLMARAGLRLIAGLTFVVRPVMHFDQGPPPTESELNEIMIAKALAELGRHFELQENC
jgi:hypothetical protein